MPRAKKAAYREPDPITTPSPLDPDTQKHLARHLGIEKDPTRIKEMAHNVEWLLTLSKISIENRTPTLGSKIRSLESLKKSAFTLFKELYGLDYLTLQTLYSYTSLKEYKTDWEKEYKTDWEMVMRIVDRLDNALKILKAQVTPGRKKRYALKRAVLVLNEHFKEYNSNNKGIEKRRRSFISEALQSADIKHPDPFDQASKFNALLKTSDLL